MLWQPLSYNTGLTRQLMKFGSQESSTEFLLHSSIIYIIFMQSMLPLNYLILNIHVYTMRTTCICHIPLTSSFYLIPFYTICLVVMCLVMCLLEETECMAAQCRQLMTTYQCLQNMHITNTNAFKQITLEQLIASAIHYHFVMLC